MFSELPFFQTAGFLILFLCCTGFSLMINFLFLRFQLNLGMREANRVDQVRWASTTKPAWGGISFFIVFLLSIGIMPFLIDSDFFRDWKLIGLISAVSLGFIVGFGDDVYNTNPLVKFLGQFACASLLILFGFTIPLSTVDELNHIITMLWVVGLMNSVNMLDNMDGITSSISFNIILAALVFLVFSGTIFTNSLAIPLIGVLGALLGFLYYNWNPSKMYMGDSGSQFLGVFLAAISIEIFWGVKLYPASRFEIIQFVLPALVFIVPLIDTTTVTIRRLARRTSPFVGGKDHITHHFAYLGLSDKQVALLLSSISFLSVLYVAFFLNFFPDNWQPAYTFISLGYFVLVFFIIQFFYQKGKKRFITKSNN